MCLVDWALGVQYMLAKKIRSDCCAKRVMSWSTFSLLSSLVGKLLDLWLSKKKKLLDL